MSFLSYISPSKSTVLSMALLSVFVSPAIYLTPSAIVRGQEAGAADSTRFVGIINASAVYVRSGPDDNSSYYATQKLDKGTSVTVVGIKGDWLKIMPPEGSFSYVASAFVDRNGDGRTGRVNRPDVFVRAGSSLVATKTTVQGKLSQGDVVQIIGEETNYLKIKPPTGAFLYVHKQFVDVPRPVDNTAPATPGGNATPLSNVQPDAGQPPARTQTPTGGANPGNPTPAPQSVNTPRTGGTPRNVNTSPNLIDGAPDVSASPNGASGQGAGVPNAIAQGGPATQGSPQIAVAGSTTQPTVSAEELFGKFENEFAQLSTRPLAEQNIDPLTAKYQTIAKSDDLSDDLKRVVELRIATLKTRSESKAKLLEARRMEKEAAERQLALKAEQQELAERAKQTDMQIYAAVGVLQPSSLQIGGGTLYRLIDPGTGRTMVYIRTSDTKYTAMMGQFVGVKGDSATDAQLNLKVIAPSDIKIVDPAKVNGTIVSEIIPPSLLARQAAASGTN